MCLAIPMELLERDDHTGVVGLKGVTRRISLRLLPEAEVGDHVLVHAGYAISRMDAEEAHKSLALLRELADSEEPRDG